MGASEINLWGLLSKDFMILVGVSLFLAIPLAYFSMSSWLQQYAYRTEISWWIPASAGAGTLAITLITVSYQSIKAARANPIKSLRSE
jgi:ABC-type antimicrobial peptide transport system permease subunit